MLKALRWKLTLLYLFAAIALVSVGGLGTYWLIDRYFQQSTDLALQYKMALQFRLLNLQIPGELQEAENIWLQNNQTAVSPIRPSSYFSEYEEGHDERNETEEEEAPHDESSESYYNADLAAVFVIMRDENSDVITVPGVPAPPNSYSVEALTQTQITGHDLRTVNLPGLGRIRLLTYRTGTTVPYTLQVGRLLSDQDRVLEQYLIYLGGFGVFVSVLLALISWVLAGRSLGPAQKAWDQQQTFVSNASHELRTPLTFIRATADYSRRTNPGKEQAEQLENILGECDYMDILVDDLLLLSRLDAQRLALELSLIPLPTLFTETLKKIAQRAENESITLTSSGYDGAIYADFTRIKQVLLILLDNALRFTPAGGKVELTAEKTPRSIEIKVIDTGAGIQSKHLPHLFERFYQVTSPKNSASRSNGLGLSIAKTLIEAHHGSIKIESAVGKGTTIIINLPIPKKKA
jgi:signal transduction histidine kinase